MNEELYELYAKEILDGAIDPFETDFDEFARKFKKQELIGFEEVGDDVMKVQRYLLEEDEEFLLEDLRGAWQAQHYIDIAESMLFEDLDEEMAKIVVNKALALADSSEDYVNIAELFIEEWDEKEKAKEAYKKGIEVAKETSDLTFVADSVADADYLADKEWARTIYQDALGLAKNMYDFVYVARSVATPDYLDDKESAKEILDVARNVVDPEDLAQNVRLGLSYAHFTDDRESSKEYFVKALNIAKNFDDFFVILQNVALADIDREFFKKIMKITLLSMDLQPQKEQVANLVEEYLEDQSLAAFLRSNSAEEIIKLFSKKDLEDLKLEYAQKILAGEIDPKQTSFKDFAKA